MDDHAAGWANRLLDNDSSASVLELLLQGAALVALTDLWIAITGADANANIPMWRTVHMRRDDEVRFPLNRSGVWTYIAVDGGIDAPRLLGSASVFARGGLGTPSRAGDLVSRTPGTRFPPMTAIAGRVVDWHERRNYDRPPSLRVWPGPQWEHFKPEERSRFFGQDWTVSSQSDRIGYRLSGDPLSRTELSMISEPVIVGSIQIPEGGLPIVTMRDGPTVGGYPKLGLVDPTDLSWLAQCRPGTRVRFCPVNED
jgi:biotin-dependent carboxylase-like uncharacterized protein